MHRTIYCHTNRVNGKRYVGQTLKLMERRWAEHVCHATANRGKGCRYINRAIRKYGADAFDHEVLETCHSLADSNAAEIKWIARLGSLAPHGYNLNAGGDAKNTHPDTRAKQSVSAKARVTPATRLEMSERRRSVLADPAALSESVAKLHAGGARWRASLSDEAKLALAGMARDNVARAHAATRRKFVVVSPDGVSQEIEGLNAFCVANDLCAGHMSQVASGKRRQHKGWTCVKFDAA